MSDPFRMFHFYRDDKWINSFCAGDRLQTPESDVARRQIQTSKDDPRTEKNKYI